MNIHKYFNKFMRIKSRNLFIYLFIFYELKTLSIFHNFIKNSNKLIIKYIYYIFYIYI